MRSSLFRSFGIVILFVFLMLSVVATASADDILVKYEDFSDTSQLQINGNAYQNSNKLRLTDNIGWQHGSVFLKDKISIGTNSFSTYFTFLITDPVGGGADGFVFVIQPNSNDVGSNGGGMGYAGISNSIGIEFDTWTNSGDISNSHIGIDINGNTGSVNSTALTGDLDLGTSTIKHAWVDYDSETNIIEVRINTTSTRPSSPQLIHNFGDQTLRDIIGYDEAYVGFTAATGGAANNHDILSWHFSNNVDETTATVTYPVNTAPVANANGPYMGTPDTEIYFDAAGSHDPDGTIVSYEWDFGDGNTTTGAYPTHTYASEGTYPVTLTVTDDNDNTDRDETTATVASSIQHAPEFPTIALPIIAVLGLAFFFQRRKD